MKNMKLTPAIQNFVLHWGELGNRWGINRTVAQIQALLLISPEPLNAEQISQTLSIARSTVSVGLRELQHWGIVNVVHRMGDRTDYYELISDVWEMFRIIADRRIKNEVEPTVTLLHDVVNQLEDNTEDPHSKKMLEELLDAVNTASRFYNEFQKVPTKTIVQIAKMSDIVSRILRLPQQK
jgi:DNA-binding transcriptional regulator GbsR (MarR family)